MQSIFSIKPGVFRLALALIVVIYHLSKYMFLGGFAVYCFFILSGYWVVRMYSEKYNNLKMATLKFYASRIIRIYPLYIAMTLLTLFMNIIFTAGYTDLLKSFNPLNWITIFGLIGYNTGPWIIPPAWSLDIEMQFYIIVPVIWLIISKLKMTTLFLFLAFLIWFNFCFNIFEIGTVYKHKVMPFLFYFILGAKLYLNPDLFSKKQVNIGVLLFIIIIVLHYIFPTLRVKVIEKTDLIYFEQINLLLPLLLLPFISYNLKVKSDKKDRMYGNLSYTIYLFHWVLIVPYNYYFSNLGFAQRMPFALIYILATVVISNYILKYFEVPIQNKLKAYV
jgi:peptidoglycan/LPS O-acetylase OafA/YrhL